MDSSHVIHSRTVRDRNGIVWQITESQARDVPGAMAHCCLIFDSQSVCRRYWKYPAEWHLLDDELLLDLMSQPRPASC